MALHDIGKRVFRLVRALSGDDAYERYLVHWRRHHVEDGCGPLSRKAFYHQEIERRWNGIKRCC